MEAFLQHIAPELAALFRSAADFFDGGPDYGPDPEDDGVVVNPPPQQFRVDERGGIVPVEG